ncbi:MAG: hypothetical protein OXG24_08880 [Gammaproteobacteria bacterium]|nr:hypothetical protein [Gammaproteobacteria bacterium]
MAVLFAARLDFVESEVFFLGSEVDFLAAVFAAGFFAIAFFVGVLDDDLTTVASSSEISTYSLRISSALKALSIAATTVRAVGRRLAGALRVLAEVFDLATLEACFFAGALFGADFEVFAEDVLFGWAFCFFAFGDALVFSTAERAFLDFLGFGFGPVFTFFELTDLPGFLAAMATVLERPDAAAPLVDDMVAFAFSWGVALLLVDRVPVSLEVFCVSAGNVI